MGSESNWDKLPSELLIVIVQKLRFCQDVERVSAVSKSWNSVVSGLHQDEKPLLPPECPLLFLAEQVAEGATLSCDFNNDEDEDGDYDPEEEDYYEASYKELLPYDYGKHSVGNARGLYSLSTRKTYYIDLPEASGRLISGTNMGWLLTLGRDMQIKLLHPLLRHHIPLPPMNTFPNQLLDIEEEPSRLADGFDIFIHKVVMSSKPPPMKNAATPNPIVMTIYGDCGYLGYARLGDNSWNNVNISSQYFEDIAFYQGKFYAVDCHGTVFVCDTEDDSRAEQIKGTKIASCPRGPESGEFNMRYLVGSHSGLWLVERFIKTRDVKPPNRVRHFKYCTTHFLAWKLELKYSGDCVETSCLCIPKKSLGDEAFFLGRASSVSLQSSEYIRPNSIYFTDDALELFNHSGGGHDMGIFSMDTGTIEPHFQGKSLHPISPPLWYI